MDTTVRATCPKCRSVLRIPAQWVGQTVKCKKCGSVVRSKPKSGPLPVPGTAPAAPLDPTAPHQAPAASGYDPAQPSAIPVPLDDEPFPLPEPIPQPPAAAQPQPQPVPGMPAYPYPVPPGYAPPPGYPYPLPPGYPYPVPPGYPQAGPYAPPPGYPYPMPPGYPNPYAPPQAAPPTPAPLPPLESTSGESEADRRPVRVRHYRRKKGGGKVIWVILCLLLTGGLVAAGILSQDRIKEWLDKREQAAEPGDPKGDPNGSGGTGAALGGSGTLAGQPVANVNRGPFPRRLLFVEITRYMYLNPLTPSDAGGNKLVRNLAYAWQVPNDPKSVNQLFLVSDTAPPPDRQTPFKNVVVGAYEQFFETSRGQDRIVVYFGGHALEKDGKAYLAPVEGELDDPNSLIPLADFYARLATCKATQKVVIWDVCRFNKERGNQRPGSEPMSENLAKALAAAPPGVEVVMTCQAGENAQEFDHPPDLGGGKGSTRYGGSAFLEALRYAAEKTKPAKRPEQSDPIPVVEWVPAVAKRTTEMASVGNRGAKQTVKVTGKPADKLADPNPDEGPARRFEIPPAPKGVAPAEITTIEREFTVPPIKPDLKDTNLAELPFLAEVMKGYADDGTVNPDFRAVTVKALDEIRKLWAVTPGGAGGPQLRDEFDAPVNDALKKRIKAEQEFFAVGIAKLELQNIALDEVAGMMTAQPKRWQANFEYARAVLKARLAYMHEYNKLLGDVLTETLPALDPKLGQNAYKLTSSEKMKSKGEAKKLAEEAQDAYARLVTEHKSTPWAIQAKRDKAFSLGLAWQPISKEK
jgi:hypothetical protein